MPGYDLFTNSNLSGRTSEQTKTPNHTTTSQHWSADVVFQVSEFLEMLNELLRPVKVTVQGEVTQVTKRGRAVYFTLADKKQKASLSCLVWNNVLAKFGIDLVEGAEIQITGHPDIYAPYGKLSFVADLITPVGEGALKAAFEKLKQELEVQGYFETERKRMLPDYPTRIGLITSNQGAAVQDFLTHLAKFGLQVDLYDVRVEGLQAVDSILAAFEYFNRQPQGFDVLVLTRGGGSLESLQAFNSLPVAQAIFASRIPVVSAVGHEYDVTIADLVADVRASTPTDAGKLLSQNWNQALSQTNHYQELIFSRWSNIWQLVSRQLDQLDAQIKHAFGQHLRENVSRLSSIRVNLEQVWPRLNNKVDFYQQQWLANRQRFQLTLRSFGKDLDNFERSFDLVDPQHLLRQGYSLVSDSTGKIIRSWSDVELDQLLIVQLHIGQLITVVKKKSSKK